MSSGELNLESSHPDVLKALVASGWYPGRTADIVGTLSRLTKVGYRATPLAMELLTNVLDLRIDPLNEQGVNFVNSEPLLIDPIGVGSRHVDEAQRIGAVLGEELFPVGWWLSYSHVYLGSSGALVAYASGLVWRLGDTPRDGIEFAVRAHRRLECLYAEEGVTPWPK
ncbi:hypothetical protein Lesp02_71300 [Lentzea sp. NBRC 105346]|uniref:SUKH-3 domain-containing protein n=1 Tax=Lentzea sp. NBRC 105346 TaxID=3032205 RepID=UPI0024A4EB1D|nr:SUKH-3 domain-containing protein [Lentzea sp. NBRC 105346]GLZ34943.1 hypothetical protein Lesp02_71300 [Lentzea sp. NBRC 105346]